VIVTVPGGDVWTSSCSMGGFSRNQWDEVIEEIQATYYLAKQQK